MTLERGAYLEDMSVTPFPLEGWDYAPVGGDYEDADGVRIVCGETDDPEAGCGEPFYLNFVRFDDGRRVEGERESEYVELAGDGPRWPQGPGGPGR